MIWIVKMNKANGMLGGLIYVSSGPRNRVESNALKAFDKLYRTPGQVEYVTSQPEKNAELSGGDRERGNNSLENKL